MIRLITFATEDYEISASRLKATALRYGADETIIYRPEHIEVMFKQMILNPLLPNSRGHGWWIWKPYFIFKAMWGMKDGDLLVWSDAGAEFKDHISHVINAMDEDIFFCSNGWQHSHWCKKEVVEEINGDEYYDNQDFSNNPPWDDEYFTFKQVQASFIIFKVNDNTKKFVQEWYAWSIMPGMIDNTPRGPQFPGFQEHRHDQAILTCLQIKYGYKLHWFPSSTGHHIPRNGDNYPEIIWHHRKKNNEW